MSVELPSVADRFDKFTDRARRALQAAQEHAGRLGHDQITAEHLLLGVVHDPTAVATQALVQLNVNVEEIARAASSAVPARAAQAGPGGLSDSARRAIELAVDEARRLDHHYVGTEHLLLGLLRVETSPATDVLKTRGVTLERARMAIASILSAPPERPHVKIDSSREESERLLQQLMAFLAAPASRPAESDAGLFTHVSDAALQALRQAHAEAQRLSHNYLGTEHILLGLVHDPQTTVARLLVELGADQNKVRNAVEFIIGRGERPHAGGTALTPRAQRVVFLALDEAHRLGSQQIGPEHLLLGIIREGEGIASGVLESLVVNTERIRTQMLESLGQAQVPPTPARVSRASRSALLQAQLVARWYYHSQVDTEHLLAGLVRERGLAARILQDLGVQLSELLIHFEALAPTEGGRPPASGLGYTLAAQAAIDRATWEADRRHQARAGSGHLLLGVVAIDGGHARTLLERLGVSLEAVRERVEPLLTADDDT